MLIFTYDKFRTEVKREMKRQYHSYRTLGKLVGIPHATLHRHIKSPESMTLRDFATICNALDISVYEMIDDG